MKRRTPSPDAPAGLWLLGEEGVQEAYCSREDVDLVKRLFPEAKIIQVRESLEPPDS